MKLIKHLFLIAVCGMFVTSCADEPLPFVPFEDLEKGAFARKLTDDGGNFFFTDPDNSAFSFSVEFYDENKGKNIASHDWYVWHRNNVDGTVSDKVLMVSNPASAFGTDPTSGLPSASYTFTLNEALAALGLTIDDVNGGDDLIFDGVLKMNSGAEFGPDNTGSSLQGNNGFDGIFRFQKPLLCVSALDGTYEFTGDSWCGEALAGQLRFDQVGDGVYDIYTTIDGEEFLDVSFGSYRACLGYATQDEQPGGDLQYIDACNKISLVGLDQWGTGYTLETIAVNNTELTISWSNGWGESATVVVINPSGWPDLK